MKSIILVRKTRLPFKLLLLLLWILSLACSLTPSFTPSAEPAAATPANAPAAEAFEAPSPPTPGLGPTYYVASDGADDNDGSESAPWATIQQAVNSVSPGDTILIESGTYTGARIEISGTEDAWITLAAAPGANVLINEPGPNNKHDSNLEFETWEGDEIVAYWLIEGLEIAEAPFWGIDIRGNEDNHSHHFALRNNRVHNNGHAGGHTGIFFAFVDDVIVEDNESHNNGEHGIYLSNSGDRFVVRGNQLHNNNNCGLHINGDLEEGEDGIISGGLIENNVIYENGEGGCAGINMDGVTDTIVQNNLLYENHGSGIAIFQENGAVCSQNIQVLHNTIVQAEDGRWGIIISGNDCINNKIFNNIILTYHEWRGSIVIPADDIPGFASDYNIIMDRFSANNDETVISLSDWQALGYDANSIIAAPDEMFVGEGDYHLPQDSLALDTGLFLPGVTGDLEGAPRPQGSAPDIGAFESGGGTTAPSEPTSSVPLATLTAGSITYNFDGQAFRVTAQEGAIPENISQALEQLSPGGGDGPINISPDGEWLVLETERFDPECDDWPCLAFLPADLSTGESIRAGGELVRSEGGISAIASGGNMVVYSYGDGPHQLDLWAVSRVGDAWAGPVLLSGDSPQEFNFQPAISDDGSRVVFMCGPEPYGGEGSSICEVSTDGNGFRVVLTPADAPLGFPITGALHQPDYAPDGSIVFEADWAGEQIWQLAPGASEPARITNEFRNDNSPCVLPDGRIVSLWLDRPDGSGLHEIKVMQWDGSSFLILLPDLDVADIGMGCAR